MKANINPQSPSYWSNLVKQTRRFGHCYVHTDARDACQFGQIVLGNIRFSFAGWGRSLNTGGHKYKVHAHLADTGEIVRSKDLP